MTKKWNQSSESNGKNLPAVFWKDIMNKKINLKQTENLKNIQQFTKKKKADKLY